MSQFGNTFRTTAAAALTALGTATAAAQSPEPPAYPAPPSRPAAVTPEPLLPAGYYGRRNIAPPCPPQPNCPPGTIIHPHFPAAPGTPPHQPGTPPQQPGTTPPATDPTRPDQPRPPGQQDPAAPSTPSFGADTGGADLGQSVALGGGVTNFGDLVGGAAFAGPLPVRVAANGRTIGPVPVVVLPNGQRVALGVTPPGASDELLGGRSSGLAPPGTPTASVRGVLPPPGTVFDESLADLVARIPNVTRGAFKITENEGPRPTTRAYFSYYFYDQVGRNFGGPDVPRITVHQEVFGYEQAFLDDQYSVGVRLPYNQVLSPGFFNQTALGDLTFVTKAVLLENRRTGNLLSAGMAVTVPTGTLPFPSTITGTDLHSTLLQPYVGYIFNRDAFFVQGFTSVIVPTSSSDVTFLANDVAIGYRAYQGCPGAFLTALVPVVELHLNTPLNHRGTRTDPAGYADSFTVLGGLHGVIRQNSTLGFAVGAPLTGPRPFSLQATVQLNYRF